MSKCESKYITPPEDCTGCGLCANVCTQNSIRMVWNADGFLVPQVNEEKCINCGLCVRKCILNAPKQEVHDSVDEVESSYGAWNRNKDVLAESSSGGVFTPLAKCTLQAGGVVYGVAWEDSKTAKFLRVTEFEDLCRLRGSKYTQAIPSYVYREVREDLKTGRQVLFSGTGCQVFALKQYLGKSYENLLTVDILCHGVPSHIILDKYVDENERKYRKKLRSISFRDKKKGWRDFHVVRHFEDGSVQTSSLRKDVYMRLFLSDKMLNRACYNCMFGHLPKPGDITLGDYWEVHKLHPEWPITEGISAVLANTEKGKLALKSINNEAELIPQKFRDIYEGQRVVYIRPPKTIPSERASYLAMIRNHPLKVAYGKLLYAFECGFIKIRYRNFLYRAYADIKKWFK